MGVGATLGGAALAVGAGLAAGTIYLSHTDPKQEPSSLSLAGTVGGVGIIMGLFLRSTWPAFANGLIGGGVVVGILAPKAAKLGAFYTTLSEYKALT